MNSIALQLASASSNPNGGGLSADNYEIIVVDDGSADSSVSIIEKYKENSPVSIRLFCKSNGGVSSARNYGLDNAKGEYIWFVDADDYVFGGSISKLTDILSSCDYDAVWLDSRAVPDSTTISLSSDAEKGIVKVMTGWEFLEKWKPTYTVWRFIFKRQAIKDSRFHTSVKIHEDGLYIAELMPHLEKVGITDICAYAYVTNNGSASRRSRDFDESIGIGINTALELRRVVDRYAEELKIYPTINAEYRQRIGYYTFMYCLWPCLKQKVGINTALRAISRLTQLGLYPVDRPTCNGVYNVSYSKLLTALWHLSRSKWLFIVTLSLYKVACKIKST